MTDLLRTALLRAAGRRGLDLSQLDRLPESLGWPLRRDGMLPSARLGELRAEGPVGVLTSFMGMNVWLVTGMTEAREVLTETSAYSSDIRPYFGRRGDVGGDIGGLGFTDPPDHTRLRRLLTCEFTRRNLELMRPRVEAIVAEQLDELAAAGSDGTPVDLAATFAFSVPFLVICTSSATWPTGSSPVAWRPARACSLWAPPYSSSIETSGPTSAPVPTPSPWSRSCCATFRWCRSPSRGSPGTTSSLAPRRSARVTSYSSRSPAPTTTALPPSSHIGRRTRILPLGMGCTAVLARSWRMEFGIAYPALAWRFPELQPGGAPVFRETSIVFGVESLPVLTGRDAQAERAGTPYVVVR